MKGDLMFENYLVVFIDLLGQKDALRKITKIPTNDIEKQEFIEHVKNSVVKVLHLRESFEDHFDVANSYVPDTTLVAPELREEFIASQETEVIFNGFSDSVIIAVPLMNSDENYTAINGVYSALVATCGIGLLFLSVGIPFRAGLDVGIGTRINEKEVYGLALERAYYLENCLAEYPRYLVGDELINYLFSVENQQPKTRLGLVAKNLAGFCRRMIIQDTDGRYMLDFLGDIVQETYKDSIDKDIVIAAEQFIISTYNKYIDQNNNKLSSRYYRLISYFNSRKKMWGIT
jgi:hypothetical protein